MHITGDPKTDINKALTTKFKDFSEKLFFVDP
jgi:hypothetical protein